MSLTAVTESVGRFQSHASWRLREVLANHDSRLREHAVLDGHSWENLRVASIVCTNSEATFLLCRAAAVSGVVVALHCHDFVCDLSVVWLPFVVADLVDEVVAMIRHGYLVVAHFEACKCWSSNWWQFEHFHKNHRFHNAAQIPG